MAKVKAGKYSANGHLMPQMREAAILLKHVSDPTRLQVISMLSEAEMFVGAMCRELNLNQPAMSHHLALLRNSGVIEPRRQGQNTYYSLTETGELLAGVVKEVTG
jgi:DNA-binding transcriptional ArsR family regulator